MWLAIRHRVRDYDAWRKVYDEHGEVRRRYGCFSEEVYRGADEPGNVVVYLKFPDRGRAEGFLRDPSLRPTMQRAGVTDEPDYVFSEPVAAKV
jgi:hypothetical protein